MPEGTPWEQIEALRWRFTFEYLALSQACKALGWRFFNPLRLHGHRWKAEKLPHGIALSKSSASELLRAVEYAEVARRAARIEREVTKELCLTAGFRLKDPRKGTWCAVHHGSRRVLEAPTSAGLREQLQAFSAGAEVGTALSESAVAWLEAEEDEEAELLEVANG